MKKKAKYFLIGIAALLLLIQLIPVNRDNPTADANLEIQTDPLIKQILEKSCYDCHSNKTAWPSYSYIAPISWIVAQHVHEGREEFNFSEWSNIPVEKQSKLKEEMIEEIEEKKMPMPMYLVGHSNAELNEQQKQLLKDWVNEETETGK